MTNNPRQRADTIVRATTPADVEGIRQILTHEVLHGVAHFSLEPPTADQIAKDLALFQPRYGWFSAVTKDQVLGFAKGGPWKTRGAYQWAAEVGIYVHHEHQGKGIGRALYDALFAYLKARGIRTVVAGITLPNPASVALHEAMGMTQAATFEKIGYKNGAWRDTGYWQLHWDGDQPPGTGC